MIQILNKIEFFLKEYSKKINYKENNGKFNYNFKNGCHICYYEPYEKGDKVEVDYIILKIKEYLEGKDKVRLKLQEDKFRKLFVYIVKRKKIESNILNKLLDIFFDNIEIYKLPKYLKILKSIAIKDIKNIDRYKIVALYMISIAKEKETYNASVMFEILDSLGYYDFNTKECEELKSFFLRYKKEITFKNSSERTYLINFLKYKVNPKDWIIFKDLLNLNLQKDNRGEEKIKFIDGEKLFFSINKYEYIKKHEILSLDDDFNVAIKSVAETLIQFSGCLSIKKLSVISNINDNIDIFVVFNEFKETNKKLIEKIIDFLIDEYAYKMSKKSLFIPSEYEYEIKKYILDVQLKENSKPDKKQNKI